MTGTIYGIITYLVVGLVVVLATYRLRRETVYIVKEQSNMFPPPVNSAVFYMLTGLLVVLFPLVLLTQIVHTIKSFRKRDES